MHLLRRQRRREEAPRVDDVGRREVAGIAALALGVHEVAGQALPVRRDVADRAIPVEIALHALEVSAREDVPDRGRERDRVAHRVEARRRVEQQRLQATDADRAVVARQRGEGLAREERILAGAAGLEILEAHERLERDARLPAALEAVARGDADEARGERVAVEAVPRLEAARLEAAVGKVGDTVDGGVELGVGSAHRAGQAQRRHDASKLLVVGAHRLGSCLGSGDASGCGAGRGRRRHHSAAAASSVSSHSAGSKRGSGAARLQPPLDTSAWGVALPFSATSSVVACPSALMRSMPSVGPALSGWNVTDMVHWLPAASMNGAAGHDFCATE